GSEIPCQVSSDVHEWCNDCFTVSSISSVNLNCLCRCEHRMAGRKDPVHLYFIFTLFEGGFVQRKCYS
ncbi:hypothetical protein M569_04734, partial [Genlisea aurea]